MGEGQEEVREELLRDPWPLSQVLHHRYGFVAPVASGSRSKRLVFHFFVFNFSFPGPQGRHGGDFRYVRVREGLQPRSDSFPGF